MKIFQTTVVLLSMLIASTSSYAQLCLGRDTTVCLNQPLTLGECGAATNIGNNVTVLNNVTLLNLSDDVWSGVVNIGFTFNYYGNNYTQCVIGSNGLVTFNTGLANSYCSYSTTAGQTFPNTTFTTTRNTAMLCYTDINPGSGGFVYYKTEGAAPNRRFYVVYENVPSFGASDCNYLALVLCEGTNNVEYHILDKQVNTNWNGGRATQGTMNNTGNAGTITPGRNNQQWTASNDGRLFTPTSPTNTNNYSVSQIPLQIIRRNNAQATNLQWRSTSGQNYPYNNGTLTIPTNQVGTRGYFLVGSTTSCNSVSSLTGDTTWVTVGNLTLTTSSTTDICSSGQGSVSVTATGGGGNYTYNWPTIPGGNTPTVQNVTTGTYQVQVTDPTGCTGNASVTVPNQNATFTATSTPVTCAGGNDGTATANMSPVIGTISYLWSDGQTTQTAIGLAAGTYTCTITTTAGCSGTVTVEITELPGLQATISNFTDVTCNSGSDGSITVSASSGATPYTYLWSTSSAATVANSPSANDLSAGSHSVIVSDANGCSITLSQTIGEPQPLSIASITPDTQICPEDEIQLTAQGAGGSSTYLYEWYLNDQMVGSTQTVTVDPEVSGTQYCVRMTEACGTSAMVQNCVNITFPTPIPPQLSAALYENCLPGLLEFTNTSPNIEELASTYIDFGNNQNGIFYNGEGGTQEYPRIGSYDLTVINTSIYGCVYTTVLPGFFTVLEPPTARFNFQQNPTSVFETVVPAYNKSTPDVIAWEWIAPGAVPSSSTLENPIFRYPEGDEAEYPVTLIVTSYLGCTDTLTLNLIIEDMVLLYAPTAFTPNGDEFNNTWRVHVKGIDVYSFNLTIFNRWGEQIFESHDPQVGWDGTYNGKLVPSGQYIWKADMRNKNDDGKHTFSGSFNLLR